MSAHAAGQNRIRHASPRKDTVRAHLGDRLLHRAPEKEGLYRSSAPLVWSSDLEGWMAFDPAIVVSILRNADFHVVDYAGETIRVIDGLGIDLSATAKVAGHLPLGLEGCPHASARKQAAIELERRCNPALRAFEEDLQVRVPALFGTEEAFDIVAELFAPLIAGFMAALSGAGCEASIGDTSPSQLFDRFLSLNKRKAVERQIRSLYGDDRAFAAPDARHLQAALAVLGFDSLLGSVGESFVEGIRSNPGKGLDEIGWSDKITVTGVPYVDRVAARSMKVQGIEIEAGQRVRLMLDVLRYSQPPLHDVYFGTGRQPVSVGQSRKKFGEG